MFRSGSRFLIPLGFGTGLRHIGLYQLIIRVMYFWCLIVGMPHGFARFYVLIPIVCIPFAAAVELMDQWGLYVPLTDTEYTHVIVITSLYGMHCSPPFTEWDRSEVRFGWFLSGSCLLPRIIHFCTMLYVLCRQIVFNIPVRT